MGEGGYRLVYGLLTSKVLTNKVLTSKVLTSCVDTNIKVMHIWLVVNYK